MTTIQPFTFEGHEVRTATVDGEPWFVAADILATLDLNRSSVALLDEDERGVHSVDTPGGLQSMSLINEAGLYSLIFRSRKEQAKGFKRWVTHEVLPAIRTTGQYSPLPQLSQQEQVLALARQVIDQAEQLQLAAPKAEAFDELMETQGLYSMEAAAKAIGYGRNVLFRELRHLGILQGNNLPYQRYMHHFEIKVGTRRNRAGETVPTHTTWVRPSGVDYLRRKLAQSQQAVERAGVLV
ncbi:phage antirepressor [Arthrobacter sp. SX1312]|uniref:phage antirepressor n=1 Tax=Arthrobacter sp. SX1312 TaxID=2058896 RepID=UPI000CE4C808|nr:phage antirepressor [Arthrobacter sp. SX1312]